MTFELQGILEAERVSPGRGEPQYDSEVVYHNIRRELVDQASDLYGYGNCPGGIGKRCC